MTLPAELHVFGLILMVYCVGYFAVFPRIENKTLQRLMMADLVLLVVLLGITGSVYANTGARFSLLVVEVKWWVFTLITAVIVEIPFALWFCRKWGIDLSGDD